MVSFSQTEVLFHKIGVLSDFGARMSDQKVCFLSFSSSLLFGVNVFCLEVLGMLEMSIVFGKSWIVDMLTNVNILFIHMLFWFWVD